MLGNVRVGELTREIPKASGGDRRSEDFKSCTDATFEKTKSWVIDELGLSKFQVSRMERMACHPEIVDEVIQDARAGMTESEKRTHARKLNMARRQLTQEQRRELIREQLRETPEKSDRQIAAGLGVDKNTVNKQRKVMESAGEIHHLEESIGSDGKQYPRQVERNRQTGTDENQQNQEATTEIPQCSEQMSDGQEERKSPEPTVIGTIVKAPPFLDEEDKQTVIEPRRPVSVFNPTQREERALQKPEVVKRMSETGHLKKES